MSDVGVGEREEVYRPGPDCQPRLGVVPIDLLVSQARADGGGSEDGFWPSVVGM